MNISTIGTRATLLGTWDARKVKTSDTIASQSVTSSVVTPPSAAAPSKEIGTNNTLSGLTAFAAQLMGQPNASKAVVIDGALASLPRVEGRPILKRMVEADPADTYQMHAQAEAAAHAEALRNNPFHDVELPPGSVALFQEHLPNIDLGGRMLAVTYPANIQRIDVTQLTSQITQDAKGNIHVPKGLSYQLIEPPQA